MGETNARAKAFTLGPSAARLSVPHATAARTATSSVLPSSCVPSRQPPTHLRPQYGDRLGLSLGAKDQLYGSSGLESATFSDTLAQASAFEMSAPVHMLPDLNSGPRAFITTDQDHGGIALMICTMMATWVVLCFLIRVFMRATVSGPFGLDDWVCSIATVSTRPEREGGWDMD